MRQTEAWACTLVLALSLSLTAFGTYLPSEAQASLLEVCGPADSQHQHK